MTIFWRLLLIGLFASFLPSPASAIHRRVAAPHPKPEYSLTQTPLGKELFRVRLVQSRSGKVLWSETTFHTDTSRVAWSKDHKRLALVLYNRTSLDAENPYKLVIWHTGHAVRAYDNVAPLRDLEGLWNLRWSLNGRRLLWLGARSQGSASMGIGRLYVVNVPVPAHYLFDIGRARKPAYVPNCDALIRGERIERAEWTGHHSIRYWTPALPEPQQTGVIRCP